jgi:putative acetyltransferase
MTFTVRHAREDDATKIYDLSRKVASIEGGLARRANEISQDYVNAFLQRSIANGVSFIACDNESGHVIGEVHAYGLGPQCFAHILGELTIAVHPDHQGKGIGRAIFSEFMDHVKASRSEILRVELIARESNTKAIEFYEKLGFVVEGRLVRRIASLGGGFEDDIPMAWIRDQLRK